MAEALGAGIFLTRELRKNQSFNLWAMEWLLVKQQRPLCVKLSLADVHLGRAFLNECGFFFFLSQGAGKHGKLTQPSAI